MLGKDHGKDRMKELEEEAEAALESVQQAMADTQEAIKKLGAAGPMPQETHSVSKA